MATYRFLNKKTGVVKELFMSLIEAEEYAKKPNIEWLPSMVPAIDPMRLGRQKPDNHFRDKLREIKRANRGSDVNTF